MPNAPARRALLVGIDKYRAAPAIPQLDGCVNDARLMESILVDQYGFDDVTVLTDGEATREGMLGALDALVGRAGAGDLVVFYYAGHGSQMTDREGDEASGLDNTLMPVDSEGWSGDNRDITDDELHLRLVELGKRTDYTTLIVDACHSGTVTRDAFGGKSRGVPPDRRPASELPPSPIPGAARGPPGGPPGASGWAPLSDRYVLIAGCRDEERSYEFRPEEGGGAVAHGALTYFLARELRRADGGTSYRDVFERAAARVTANNAAQHPQMEGRVDRAVFGVTDLDPMRFTRVLARDGDAVTLAAGAAHGMTVGSTYAVYPQGTKQADGVAPLGAVEVTAVRAARADARVVEESAPGAVAADARAVEREHAYAALRFGVQVVAAGGPAAADGPAAAAARALETLLGESRLLELVAGDAPASARAYALAPRAAAGPADPVPQLGPVVRPTWAVVGTTGELLMPPIPLGEHALVRENLERLARQRHGLALENPDAASAMRGKFALELLRRAADGAWVPAAPERAGGLPVFEEGEAIAFEVTSRHAEPAYVYLVDFGPTGYVFPLYPIPPNQPTVDRGVPTPMTFAVNKDGELADALEFPSGFPFAEGDPHAPAEAVETIKMIVTREPADFGFLAQDGVAAGGATRGGPAESPLQLLFETALGAGSGSTRDLRRKRVPVDQDDWTTVARPFVVRRRTGVETTGGAEPVAAGAARLAVPGVVARVAALPPGTGRAAAAGLAAVALDDALASEGADVRQTVEIAGARPAPGARSADAAGPARLEVPDAGPDFGQMVVRTDELGVVSWHFAPEPDARPAARGAGAAPATRTFELPAPRGAGGAGGGARGVVGAIANAVGGEAVKQFLKVVVFPRLDPIVGAVAEDYALRWEGRKRPYRVRAFTPDDYASPDGRELDADGWRALGAGRALLLVHGTFSRAHAAFGGMPREFVEALHRRYDGRVFAFDHFTLSHDPRANVSRFLELMPQDGALDVDVVCHSRGGLVSRVLAERQGELSMGGRRLRVGRVVFVGTPNAGTTLCDAEHMAKFIDTFSTLLNLVPSAGASEVLSGVVTVAKMLAVGAAGGLPGLTAMQPGGAFAKGLNAGDRAGETRYFALASDYAPGAPGLRAMLQDRLMDKVFGAGNDLVVPTDGVFAANGSGYFPIEDRAVFSGAEGVAHTTFFESRAARDTIMRWLSA